MAYQLYDNKLKKISAMGFRVTWNLIYVGLKQYDSLEPQISFKDLFDYLKDQIGLNQTNDENYIAVLVNENEPEKAEQVIEKNRLSEKTSQEFEMRKWRALELNKLLTSKEDKSLLITKLYDFWLSFAFLKENLNIGCNSSVNFLSQNESDIIDKHIQWLKGEIDTIIATESKARD